MTDNSLNFVLCPSYHGATLLSIILNAHPEVAALGDTIPKWEQICACKKKVVACDFWTPIIEATKSYHSSGGWLLDSMPNIVPSAVGNRNIALGISGIGLLAGKWATHLGGKPFANYLAGHEIFRQAVLTQTDSSLFVDGQKSLTKAVLHRAMSERRKTFRIIHLVRDPRGFLASNKRSADYKSIEKSAYKWKRGHQSIAALKHPFFRSQYHLIRYEDICANPQTTIRQLFAFLGLPPCPLDNLKDEQSYHLLGNKMLHHFDGNIRLSTKWKEELAADEAEQMLELTRPISKKYGYE